MNQCVNTNISGTKKLQTFSWTNVARCSIRLMNMFPSSHPGPVDGSKKSCIHPWKWKKIHFCTGVCTCQVVGNGISEPSTVAKQATICGSKGGHYLGRIYKRFIVRPIKSIRSRLANSCPFSLFKWLYMYIYFEKQAPFFPRPYKTQCIYIYICTYINIDIHTYKLFTMGFTWKLPIFGSPSRRFKKKTTFSFH